MIIEFSPGKLPKSKEALKDIILEAVKKSSTNPDAVNAGRQPQDNNTKAGVTQYAN
jgi:hypothetical protein